MKIFLKYIKITACISIVLLWDIIVEDFRKIEDLQFVFQLFVDVSPNVITCTFVFLIIATQWTNFKERVGYSCSYTLGIIAYEFLQLTIEKRTFDWFDILASLICLSLFLAYVLFKHKSNQKNIGLLFIAAPPNK